MSYKRVLGPSGPRTIYLFIFKIKKKNSSAKTGFSKFVSHIYILINAIENHMFGT
jgi:hypothetical protein